MLHLIIILMEMFLNYRQMMMMMRDFFPRTSGYKCYK